MRKFFCLADYGAAFATRAKGADIADILSHSVASLNDGDSLLIDFKGVEALSHSFADELFSRILEAFQREENTRKSIVVAGWSNELLVVLDQILHRRRCSLAPSVSSQAKETGERILKCPANVA